MTRIMSRLQAFMLAALVGAQFTTAATAQPPPAPGDSLDALLRKVQTVRTAQKQLFDRRVADFSSAAADEQQAMVERAESQRNEREAASQALSEQHSQNEIRINELNGRLVEKAAGLGLAELFGVARQVAGDAATALQLSLRQAEAQAAQAREAEFVTEQHRQERLAQEALARRNAAESRSNALDRLWQDNETHINELTVLLRQHEGNLGELFGVTRQVAGDAANVLQQSQLSVAYIPTEGGEERAAFLRRVAAARALPSITELERLWFELHREMTDGGKVMRLGTNVVQHDGTGLDIEVVLIGPFSAVAHGGYLGYLPSRRSLTLLEGQLPAEFRDTARFLQNISDEDRYVTATVDPARGALLGLWLLRPDVIERIGHGKEVGYVIISVGVLAALAAFLQFVWLARMRLAVRAQLADPASPSPGNPLGRVMLAVRGDGTAVASPEVAELRLSEAVLREVPKLERFQAFLRLAVAAGPLLGLIGTVIGMIITFKAITASGTSDPKLMAQGIGQAMIATVLGLGIAIPLLFINAGLGAVSRSITQLLEEQCHGLLATVVTVQEDPWESAV